MRESFDENPAVETGFEEPEVHPTSRPQAGRPVTRSAPRPDHIPGGGGLSPEASARLQEELRDIDAARMAVRGSDVIIYPTNRS